LVIYAGNRGFLDKYKVEDIKEYKQRLFEYAQKEGADVLKQIADKKEITPEIDKAIESLLIDFDKEFKKEEEAKEEPDEETSDKEEKKDEPEEKADLPEKSKEKKPKKTGKKGKKPKKSGKTKKDKK